MQLHFASVTHRTSEIMRVLTLITAIFMPLTLITGIFGMNFEMIPGLHSRWGFWLSLGGMGGVVCTATLPISPQALDLMQIWVDADACPAAIKDILYRAAERAQVMVTLVANQALRTPPSAYIRAVQVPRGFDVADNEIVRRMRAGDLIVTADIPLAAEVLEHGGHALNPRGERYSADTIRERLVMRDLLDELRGSGVATDGPAAFSPADRHAFARSLDSLLAQRPA